MSKLLLAAVLILAATPAFAYCPDIPDDVSTGNIANQRQLTLCRAAELHDSTALKAQELQVQAELQASRMHLELEQRMQQTFGAAATAATFPQFN